MQSNLNYAVRNGLLLVIGSYSIANAIESRSSMWLCLADLAITPIVDAVAAKVFNAFHVESGKYREAKQFLTRVFSIVLVSGIAVACGLPTAVAATAIKVTLFFRAIHFLIQMDKSENQSAGMASRSTQASRFPGSPRSCA